VDLADDCVPAREASAPARCCAAKSDAHDVVERLADRIDRYLENRE